MVVQFLIFWGTSLFSIVAIPTYISTISAGGLPFFHTLSNLFISYRFDDRHFDRCNVVSHCCFACVSITTSCWASFHVPVGLLCIIFGRMSFQFLCPFWKLDFFFLFLLLTCMSSLCFLESKLISDIWLANIFSHFVSCAFTLMIISLVVQKHFCLLAFVVTSKKWLPRPMSRSSSPMFSSSSFFFSGFMSKSLVCFELIFMNSVRYGSEFILMHMFVQFSQH